MKPKSRQKMACLLVIVLGVGVAFGARIRPGGDPERERVIWADPFDNYSQWAYDNGKFWEGGPMPPGVSSGSYPSKSVDNSGCGVSIQTYPAIHGMAREQWQTVMNCGPIMTPGGRTADPGAFEAHYDGNCGVSDEVVTTRGMFAQANYTWGQGGTYSSMTMWSHSFRNRIMAMPREPYEPADANAVNGTDEYPLVVVFYLNDGGGPDNARAQYANSYVELSFEGDHAPTDYIWRGHAEPIPDDPEYCPQGPYPIICQQRRIGDTAILNTLCPPLVPPYDPVTETGKTWRSIAFGFLAILDGDPCELQSSIAHNPERNHPAVFDGNQWSEIRAGRYSGLSMTGALPWPPENNMFAGTGACDDFSLGGGDHRVYLKIVTDYILIYMTNRESGSGVERYWHAAVPRVYKGGFDTISWGVAPGCEVDPATGECKVEGTPTQCLTYSTNYPGYDRTRMDSMSIFDGVLVHGQGAPPPVGACCHGNGQCIVTDQGTCEGSLSGSYHGNNPTCEETLCCPHPFADADKDGDVDQSDFAVLQACFSGPDGGLTTPFCECLDQDHDQDVDQDDYGAFEDCATGPGIPSVLTPACQ